MICILGAVNREIAGIKGRMKIVERFKLGHATAWVGILEGKEITLIRTGIGKGPAAEALTNVLERFSLSLVVSTGYMGAADPRLKVADVLVADQVLELKDSSGDAFTSKKAAKEYAIDPSLLELTANVFADGATVFRGGLLTVDRVVAEPQDKVNAGQFYSVLGIDMETSALARLAGEKGVPFISVRAVSDTVDQKLVDISPFLEADGEVSTLKAGWHVLTHPGKIKNLVSLREHSQRATRSLTQFLGDVLKQEISV